jgi:hypothetical protein
MVHFSPPSNRNYEDNDMPNVPFLQQRNSAGMVKGTLDFDAAREK